MQGKRLCRYLWGNMADRRGKLALFIDGVKLHAMAKALGFEIDYKKLLEVFNERGKLLRAFYYTTVMDDLEYCAVRPLVDWLDYNGYMVVTKPIREFVDDGGRRKIKTNTDIEFAVGAMETADHVDEIVLFSGHGNLRPLLAALQRRGVRVTVVSTTASEPPVIVDEIRRQADEFVDLTELAARISRTPPATLGAGEGTLAIVVERRRSAVEERRTDMRCRK